MFDDPTFVIDSSGEILWANGSSIDFFSLGPGLRIASNYFDLLEETARDSTRQRHLLSLRKGQGLYKAVFRDPAGRNIPAKVSIAKFDAEGNAFFLVQLKPMSSVLGQAGEHGKLSDPIDPLTGLYFRGTFEHWNPVGAYALAMVDVDDLKLVNDTYGHAAGDHLLAKVGAALETVLDSSNSAYRYGGDEFVITGHRADDLQQKLNEAAVLIAEMGAGTEGPVHISYGVADSFEGDSKAGVLSVADSRMYEEKSRRKQRPLEDALELSLLVAEEMESIGDRTREGEWTVGNGRTAICGRCLDTGQGSIILLTGGDRPHIGAVAVGPGLDTIVYPGHRDDEITDLLSKRLKGRFPWPMVIAAGFHVESITPDEIEEVLENTDSLASLLLEFLKDGG